MDEISQLRLRKAIQNGLPLTAQPYLTLAEELGLTEAQVMDAIQDWQDDGLIKRFGLVVKHHALGYTANAMVVWNVPNESVDQVGEKLSQSDAVTLCYQRPRRLPEWNYNLFSMIHGKDRDTVLQQLSEIISANDLGDIEYDVLFSYKLFKQCGGQYVQPSAPSGSSLSGVAL